MKISKKLLLVFVCMLIVIMCGCGRAPQISGSESARNFSKYEKLIRMIANKYDLTMKEINDPNYSDEKWVNKDFELSGKDMLINVGLENTALDTEEKGEEKFLIVYSIPDDDYFDLDLFTELVNLISGKAISKIYCDEFLSNVYLGKNVSLDCDDLLIYDSKPLNFEEEWVISYTLREAVYPSDYPQELEFTGLTIGSFKASAGQSTGEACCSDREPFITDPANESSRSGSCMIF